MKKKFWFTLLICACILAFTGGVFSAKNSAEEAPVYDYYALTFDEFLIPDYTEETKVTFGATDLPIIDGKFTPTKNGTYIITYPSGEQKTLFVMDYAEEETVAFSHSLKQSYACGEIVTLPSISVSSSNFTANSFDLYVYRNGTLESKYLDISTETTLQSYEVADYELEYFYSDMFGAKQTADRLSFSFKSERVIVVEPLPDAFLFNTSYELKRANGFFEGRFYPATLEIEYPNGTREVYTDNTFKPSLLGEYKFHYSSTVAGETLQKTISCLAVGSNVGLFTYNNQVKQVADGVTAPTYASEKGKTGIEFLFASRGAEIAYSSVVDLRTLTKEDNLFSFYALQSKNDEPFVSMREVRMEIVDAYDYSNSIKIRWWRPPDSWTKTASYLLADNGSGEYGRDNHVQNNNALLNYYGSMTRDVTFRGAEAGKSLPFCISYDYETNGLYSTFADGLYMIYDLDDDIGATANTWKGFTTGEVYIKLSFTIADDNSGILLTEVAGQSLGEEIVVNQEDNSFFVFEEGREYVQNMPQGAVGVSYPLPVLKKPDYILGSYASDVKLYFVNGNEKTEVTVQIVNGVFTPDKAGEYELLYEAKNAYGVVAKKSVVFEVAQTITPLEISMGKPNEVVLENEYRLPNFSVTGGSGYATSIISATLNGKTLEIKNNSVFLEKEGELLLTVKATDVLGYYKERTFTIDCRPFEPYLFVADVPLVVDTASVVFPDFRAVNFTLESDDSGYEMTKHIRVNGSLLDMATREYAIPSGVKTLSVEYIGGLGTTYETVKTYEVKVVSSATSIVDYLIFDKSKIRTEVRETETVFSMSESASIKMPSVLLAQDLSFEFALNKNQVNFSAVRIILTDSVNVRNQVAIYVTAFDETNSDLKINENGIGYKVLGSFTGENNKFSFVYDDACYIKTSLGAKICDVEQTVYGESFTGFKSKYVTVEIGLLGVTAQSQLIISSISNQNFGSIGFSGEDFYGPKVGLSARFPQYSEVGVAFSTPIAYAGDFFDGKCSVSVTVLAPNGAKLLNKKDASKSYEFTLEQLGFYQVIYESCDDGFMPSKMTKRIEVVDRTAPSIRLTSTLKDSYKTSESVELHYEVTDNFSSVTHFAYVLNKSSLKMTKVTDGFSFGTAGEYLLVICVYDEKGNYARLEYEVTVK